MSNFDHLPRTSTYMNHFASSCYDNEKYIYAKMVNEIVNHFGVKCFYYIVDYNTAHDVVYGEDMDRYAGRKFPLQVYFTAPPEDDLVSRFGIEGLDNFEMFTPKIQFDAASTLAWNDTSGTTSGTFQSYEPKPGDLIRTTDNDRYYEILDVGEESALHLQTKSTWTFKVRKYRDAHVSIETSATAVSATLSAYTDQDDMFDIADDIDTLKAAVIITSADDLLNGNNLPDDPFGGW